MATVSTIIPSTLHPFNAIRSPSTAETSIPEELQAALMVSKMMPSKLSPHMSILDIAKVRVLQRHPAFDLKATEVKASTIHGRGLFAIQDFKKGDIVTFYPAHIIELTPHGNRSKDGHMKIRLPCHPSIPVPKHEDINEYLLSISPTIHICGIPSIDKDPSYCGHLINDGARPSSDPRSHPIYEMVSKTKANVTFSLIHDTLMAMRATRDIEAGEEIFVSYGLPYWKTQMRM